MIDVVCAVIKNEIGEVLLARRSSKRDIGKWEFPGGKVTLGEDLLTATEREINEELGIHIQAIQILHFLQYAKFNLYFIESILIDGCYDPILKEHDQIEFFQTKEIPLDQLTPGDREFVISQLR